MNEEPPDPKRAWTLTRKPPPDRCPGAFCFHFEREGGLRAPGLHATLDEALGATSPAPAGGCGWTRGVCARLDPLRGDRDFYEPHEPELERAGLPWFFFIPSAAGLTEEARAEYDRESRRLWGDPGDDG